MPDTSPLPFRTILVAAANPDQANRLAAAARCFASTDGRSVVEVIHVAPPNEDQSPLDLLLEAAGDFSADLLVVGARSHTLASRLAMLAPCPVLMVPEGHELSMDHILVPVDLSQHSADALRVAAALAGLGPGSRLSVLSVDVEDAAAIVHDPGLDGERRAEHEQELRQFTRSVIGGAIEVQLVASPLRRSSAVLHHPGLSLPHAIEGADVAATIAQIADEESASLIVVGTRGRSRSAGVLLGSVTEKLIQFARPPVLAMKRAGAHLSILESILGRIARPSTTHTN